jgi:hypothetical protein
MRSGLEQTSGVRPSVTAQPAGENAGSGADLLGDFAAFTHFLVAHVEDEVRERLGEGRSAKARLSPRRSLIRK